MKTLVAGWFSFEGMNVTAGDVRARDLSCQWLTEAGQSFDVANSPLLIANDGGVDWRTADAAIYEQVVFVCGPFRDNEVTAGFLAHFAGKRLVGLNLSMIEPLTSWNPFDVLLERDSSITTRPDMVFGAGHRSVPTVGLLLVHPQPQYKKRALHTTANAAIHRLIAAREAAVVPIDTCLEHNKAGLRTPAEIESLIARMDLVITTRLHGMVMALKHGVPALAVDPIAGGAKVRQQANAVDWPVVFTADRLDDAELQRAFDYCTTNEARVGARECGGRGASGVERLREAFVASVSGTAMVGVARE